MVWSGFAHDARHAARLLLRAPAFSVIAVLTFAVGIGVNTAVFNVVNGVLLRALPYPDADRITLIWMDNRREGIKEDITSYPNYRDWRDQSSSYAHMAAFTPSSFTLTGVGDAERLIGATVTANFFDVMGVPPVIGRLFTAANEAEGQDAVVLLSSGLWHRQFGGRADILGSTITLNGRPHEIVGVMPATLQWPSKAEVWKPLAPPAQTREARNSFWLPVIGRLKPGVSPEQAQTEMSGIATRLEQEYEGNRGFGTYVVPLQEQLVGSVERPLLILLAAVGFVLLIACANLANLMLGRTAARSKELAIRTAIGAGRARLIRQIVTETLVVALAGGAVGLVLAYWATQFFVSIGGESIPRADAIAMDARVLAFALLATTIAALLSGVVPALQASRRSVTDHLREGGRQGGPASHRTRSALVAIEVALAVVLLTGAGLLLRTFWSMQQVERGFDANNVAVVTVSLSPGAYADVADVRSFYARVLERVRAIPGVVVAATTTGVLQPLVTNSGIFSAEGQPLPPPEQRVEYPFEAVSPGFFEALRIRLLRGRTFTEADHAEAPRVVIVNHTLARDLWGDQDPIGRRLRSGGETSQAPWMTVIGVIADVHRSEVTRAIRPELYVSALQSTPRTQTVILRTAGEARDILPLVRREVSALDPQLALFDVGTLEAQVSMTLTQPRFQATLLTVFAGVALLLAAIGVYGVTAQAVGERTQEVGIRMALGARRGDVLSLVLNQHIRPALLGLGLGLAGSLALSGYIRSLLYGVGATDPVTLGVTALTLLTTAAVACWIPARRATRVDPVTALRSQ
jgi:putative ABC transport system permease protein